MVYRRRFIDALAPSDNADSTGAQYSVPGDHIARRRPCRREIALVYSRGRVGGIAVVEVKDPAARRIPAGRLSVRLDRVGGSARHQPRDQDHRAALAAGQRRARAVGAPSSPVNRPGKRRAWLAGGQHCEQTLKRLV